MSAVLQEHDYEIINGRRVVKKHVATIHCANKLSLRERKISNALLYHAFPNLKKSLTHTISLDQLKTLLNVTTRDHKAIKTALTRLMSTVIEWNVLGEDIPEMELEGWNASTILSSVSIKKGLVTYQYSELLKTLIIDPKIYGKINLIIQSRFKSSYALALYENCSRYRGLKYTKNFSLTDFRKLMGIEEGQYEIFRDFNRRVLAPAVDEINSCSDIRITSDITRRGRKVESIKFVLEERPIKKRMGMQCSNDETVVKSVAFNDGSHQDCSVLKLLKDKFNAGDKDITALTKNNSLSRINEKMQLILSSESYKQGRVRVPLALLKSAIEKNYVNTNVVISQEKALPFHIRAEKKQEKQVMENLKDEYIKYRVQKSQKAFESLDANKQKEVEEAFIKGKHSYRGHNAMACYSSLGINNVLVFESGLANYLIAEHPDLMDGLLTFDEFKESCVI